MNIVLTGFMASGKTTVGRRITELSDYEFIDTDEMIVEREGRSINDIFAADGEEYFRRVEREVIREAAKLDNKVISTGGGVVLNPENIEELRKNGIVFNLDPDFPVIEQRVTRAAQTRPLMQNQSIEDIKKRFDDRKPLYDNCDYKIHITEQSTPSSSAKRILEIITNARTIHEGNNTD